MNVPNEKPTRILTLGNIIPWAVFITARLSLSSILSWLFGDKLVDGAALTIPLSLVLGAGTYIAMNHHRQAVRKALDSAPVATGAGVLLLLNLYTLNQALDGELTTRKWVVWAIAVMTTSYLWRAAFHFKA